MRDPDIIRRNERLKAFTGQMYNLGAAPLAAAMVKLYGDKAPSVDVAVWTFGAASLIWGGHGLLSLIEDEG